jgi:MoxR-like ATPase
MKAAAAEFREIFADMELSTNDARGLFEVYQRLPGIPSDAEVSAWADQSVRALREAYGNGAEEALADARALVARDPRIKAFLNVSGLGSHPKVIVRLAHAARSQRGRGRL